MPRATIVLAGAAVGLVGGVIGLGGAAFRLPLLIVLFGFAALEGRDPEQGQDPDWQRPFRSAPRPSLLGMCLLDGRLV